MGLTLRGGLLAVAACIMAPGSPARAEQEPGAPSIAEENQKHVDELLKQIAGQENKPASEVFKNVQVMKGLPAGRLLQVMQIGFARSLGVRCTHCHVAGSWESDDKHEKQAARGMMAMVRTINQDLLKDMPGLESEKPTVNCTTCHRGQVKPALDLTP